MITTFKKFKKQLILENKTLSTKDIAVQIYDKLVSKGAGIGNASIAIIKKVLDQTSHIDDDQIMADQIFTALKNKGADISNASITFIKSVLNNYDITNENVNTQNIAKGLSDLDQQRPLRMKAPDSSDPHHFPLFNSKHYSQGGLYIQDQMEDMLMDKYGEERGKKLFNGILNAPKFGAFFQQGDKIAREKSKMMSDLQIWGNGDYFQYSYFSLWKLWMDSIGAKYVIPTQEEIENKKAIKKAEEDAAKEKERLAQLAKRSEDNQKYFDGKMQTLRQRFGKLLDIQPDSKDLERLKDVTTKNHWSMETYVQKMANSIKDATKAARRGTAIISLISTNVSKYNALNLAEIFFNRALQLGAVTEGIIYETSNNDQEYKPKYAGQKKVANDIDKKLKKTTSKGAINASEKLRNLQKRNYYKKLGLSDNEINKINNNLNEGFINQDELLLAKNFERALLSNFTNVSYIRNGKDNKNYDYSNGYIGVTNTYECQTWIGINSKTSKILEACNIEAPYINASFTYYEVINNAKPKSSNCGIGFSGNKYLNNYRNFDITNAKNVDFVKNIKNWITFSENLPINDDLITRFLQMWKTTKKESKDINTRDIGIGRHSSIHITKEYDEIYNIKDLNKAFNKTENEMESIIKSQFRFKKDNLVFDWKQGIMLVNGTYTEVWD